MNMRNVLFFLILIHFNWMLYFTPTSFGLAFLNAMVFAVSLGLLRGQDEAAGFYEGAEYVLQEFRKTFGIPKEQPND